MIKINRFENSNMVRYVCKDVKELKNLVDIWKKEFRDQNKIGIRDKSYERYCEDLDSLVKKYEVE
jgi:hypothetical protein